MDGTTLTASQKENKMQDLVREYWAQLSAGAVGFLWLGKMSAIISGLRKRIKNIEDGHVITVSDCELRSAACKKFFESEITHGNKQSSEIKGMIVGLEKKINTAEKRNEDRHKELTNNIMKFMMEK